MAVPQINVFEAGKSPGAHHQETDGDDQRTPSERHSPPDHRLASGKVHNSGDDARAAGNGQANKILLSRLARIRGLRILCDVESRQPARACSQKNEAGDHSQLHQPDAKIARRHVDQSVQIEAGGQAAEAPHPRQNGRCHTKGDDIGKRIELAPEVAGGMRHACDASIEAVEEYGDPDGFGGVIEVPGIGRRSLHGLQNGEVTRCDVARGEERGQQIDAFAEAPAARLGKVGIAAKWRIHRAIPASSVCCSAATLREGSGRWASTLDPPLTRSPILTVTRAWGERITSVREPNFIMPIRSPRSTRSPILLLNTMRLASKPAICLSTTVSEPLAIVVTFCSLHSAHAGFIAFKNF